MPTQNNPIENPTITPQTPNPNPSIPNEEGQELTPRLPDPEINPAKTGNDTEIEFDPSRIENDPRERPPEIQ